ncbi:MAG: DUF4214 domain-containing protein [Roseibium sp.]|nr:DUF4214 domain-containing protein [Roseibium sp.]
MTTSATVTQFYNNVLQRAPTASELSGWVALIDSGALTSAQALDAIVNSSEAQTFVAQVVRIYQAAFGRVPDTTGIDGWVDGLVAGTTTTTELAAGFVLSAEWTARYGSTEVNITTLTGLYQNVLGRTPSGAEVDAWIATGLGLEQVLLGFANSAEFQANISGAVNTLLTTAGNTATANIATVFDGTTSLGTGDAGVGQTFTLTTGIDNVTGTDNADTIIGSINAAAEATQTYQTGDTVDGGGGTDAFNITITDNTTSPLLTTSNVENFFIQDTANSTINAQNWSSPSQIWNNQSSGNLTVDNIGSLATIGLRMATGQTDIQFTDSVVSGSSDALSIVTEGTGTSAGSIDLDVGNASGIGNAVIETVTITSQGSAGSFLDVAGLGSAVTSISIAGSQGLQLDAVDVTALNTVDASSNSGGVTLDLDAGARDLTVTGSSGNDSIDVSGTYDANDTINGGDGTDTLLIGITEADPAAVQSNVSNFEILAIVDDASNDEVDASRFGVNQLRFDTDSAGGGGAPVVSGLTSGATIILNTGLSNFGGTTAADINLSDAAGSGDSLTLDINNTAGPGNVDVDITGIETFTIDASGSDQANSVDLDAAQVSSITVLAGSGANDDVTLTFGSGGTIVSTVDASGTTGSGGLQVTLDAATAVTGATVTGTGNADVINGTNQADSLISGAGNDALLGAGGNDAIDISGGGSNQIDFLTTAALNGTDTVTGFNVGAVASGGDTLDTNDFTGITVAAISANITNLTGNQAIADDTIYTVNFNAAINGKDFGGADFADLFAAAGGVFNTTVVAATESVIVVQGTDETQVYLVNGNLDATNTDVSAADVGQVALLAGVTNSDTFVDANFV